MADTPKTTQGPDDTPKSSTGKSLDSPKTPNPAGESSTPAFVEQVEQGLNNLALITKRLSGAGRKRMRHLIQEGHSPEDARKMAEKPIKQDAKRRKPSPTRTRAPPEGGHKEAVRKAHKRPAAAETVTSKGAKVKQHTFRDALVGVKIGILHSQHPENMLTTQHMEEIQTKVLEMILEAHEGVHPQFHGTSFKPGWMIFNCKNEPTSIWLRNCAEKIKINGIDIIAVEEDKIPRPEIMIAYLPNSQEEDNNKILGYIKSQNPGLETGNWRVLNRIQVGNTTQLTMNVDQKSVEAAKALKFKISYKFGEVTLRKKGWEPKENPPNVQEDSGAGPSTQK